MENKILTLDYDKLKVLHPKAVEEVSKWFKSREDLIGALKSENDNITDKEINDYMDHISKMVISYDPRKLYDFFDSKKIYLYIGGHPDTTELFVYHNSIQHHSMTASSRIEAEERAFMEAFKMLDSQLS